MESFVEKLIKEYNLEKQDITLINIKNPDEKFTLKEIIFKVYDVGNEHGVDYGEKQRDKLAGEMNELQDELASLRVNMETSKRYLCLNCGAGEYEIVPGLGSVETTKGCPFCLSEDIRQAE